MSQVCHCWCPPLSVGHAAFLFFCLAGLSPVCPCVLAMKHFYSFVCQVRHCWCHVAFICFPSPLLLLSALFRWPCSTSIHLSPRSVTAGVRPFQRFYSLVSQVCHCWCPPFFRWRCNISIHLFSTVCTSMMHGERSRSWMPLALISSCHRDQAF